MNNPDTTEVIGEDLIWLKEFLGGDETAFVELMRKYKTGVYRVVISILKDRRSAEEATEDTFVKLYKKAHTFKKKSSFKTWLYTIAANTARNYRKKLMRRKNRETSYNHTVYDVKSSDDPIKKTELKGTIEVLEDIVDELPERQREVFRMKYISGLKIREIAELLGLSEGGVKSSLSIALKKVREDMEPHMEGY